MLSITEENYLKIIFSLAQKSEGAVNTNAIAAAMNTTAASVTDMLKRLGEKSMLSHEKYRGVMLTEQGTQLATQLIRRHRLWEVFLTEKLGFSWDQVHDVAEQLEHVTGHGLIERLDAFLEHPRFDPHGDPIPDAHGRWWQRHQLPLAELPLQQQSVVTGVGDHSKAFLQYLQQLGITLGTTVEVVERIGYDFSIKIKINQQTVCTLSEKASRNLLVGN
jgi:DtxR family transcriptional regulator, Mn-dependent transcriptional regulator